MVDVRYRKITGATTLAVLFACGSRTGLLSSESEDTDGGSFVQDASIDVRIRRDGAPDAPLPMIDAMVPSDVDRRDCPDPSTTFIYVVTNNNQLLSFYPPNRTFRTVGTLACPNTNGATPFSMAVDRRGLAYVLYNNGSLYRVSTLTAACTSTPYRPGQQGFQLFGMGFSSNQGGPAETLFVAGDAQQGGASGLARIDTTSFALTPLGDALPSRAELTGTGDGRLFAFYGEEGSSSRVGQVDKVAGSILAEDRLTIDQGSGWAFAFWGGDFYLFTGQAGGSVVTRYDPMARQESPYSSYGSVIVGAGVSTCAPAE